MKKSIFLSCFLLTSSLCAAQREEEVNVGIVPEASSVTLGPGDYSVRNPAVRNAERLKETSNTTVRAGPLGLVFGGRDVGKKLLISPALPDGRVVVNGRPYRGAIVMLWKSAKRLTVVNRIPLEDYVRGILTVETNPEWPLEALKAQAVASRAYVLSHRNRHGDEGYDVCAETHCQVYRGLSAERPRCNAAVEATEGLVALYKGKPINASFHSCCGGRTEFAGNVWKGSDAPYLRSVRCHACRTCPKFLWKVSIDREALSRRLTEAGQGVGVVKNIKVLSRSRSGRAYEIRIEGTRGQKVINANQFRLAAGPRVVQSTLWSALSKKGGGWLFIGHGWGHGVGLCQWGAKGLADEGDDFKRILKFYYSGISIGKYED